MRIVYSKKYNIGFYGFERLHPFDSRKYGRAWRALRKKIGRRIRSLQIRTDRQVNLDEILLVHTPDYLRRLRQPSYLARAIEVPLLKRAPSWAIDFHVLRPMRWATRGTIIAAESALECGLAVNLSGGYHHAKPDRGEGFSIYADAAIAVHALWKSGRIDPAARVLFIDTDAHQGNGVCHNFMHDSRAFIFDMFNSNIYPMLDTEARRRIDCEVPVNRNTTDQDYLSLLRAKLPGFLDSVCNSKVGIAFYNAGTDVFAGDPLGDLNLSSDAILERDLFVISELRNRGIPTVMLLSGGYTAVSYQLVANSVGRLVEQFGNAG